jgi:hypothetical protein
VVDYHKAIKELAILAYPADYLNITVTGNKRFKISLALCLNSIWEYRFRAKWSTVAQGDSGGYKDCEC